MTTYCDTHPNIPATHSNDGRRVDIRDSVWNYCAECADALTDQGRIYFAIDDTIGVDLADIWNRLPGARRDSWKDPTTLDNYDRLIRALVALQSDLVRRSGGVPDPVALADAAHRHADGRSI
jgi:hypothetical protein